MRFIKWSIITVFWLSVGSGLFYSLPQRDIVQIKGTEILRADLSGWNRVFHAQSDSGNDATLQNRDLRLINTRTARERPYVLLVVGHPSSSATVPRAAGVKKPLETISSFI